MKKFAFRFQFIDQVASFTNDVVLRIDRFLDIIMSWNKELPTIGHCCLVNESTSDRILAAAAAADVCFDKNVIKRKTECC